MIERNELAIGTVLSVLAVALLFLLAPVGIAAARGGFTVVGSPLDNPRGLAFGPDGALYVAEAGAGGSGPCLVGPEGQVCYGTSGGVTRISGTSQSQIVTGLPSLASFPTGTAAVGPHDIGWNAAGDLEILIGYGGDPANRDPAGPLGPAGMLFGRIAITNTGGWTVTTDVAGYEGANDPDGDGPDSNPWSMVSEAGRVRVSDSGANAIFDVARPLSVGTSGITTVTVVPDRMVSFGPTMTIPMDSVPTGMVQGPGGDYYFGELTGFPFPVGQANVYRIDSAGNRTVFRSGFTNITDIAFGSDDSLYVLEINSNGLLDPAGVGSVIKVAPDDSSRQTVATGLVMPTGMVYGPDNMLYVSNFGIFSAGEAGPSGQVIQIDPSPPTAVTLGELQVEQSRRTQSYLLVFGAALGLFMVSRRLRRT